ncbi:transcriptional regulator, LysR family [Desulfuromusa kysingii]|uniref:Transcriptional regulator, LysR family n=1 Tax=Desulfuromusa kysingii TaxID=37625 RepID=A0A1H3YUM7_9BACT|nr:LysR substrate-binding domain-containing protein [Desulfuromusa kysingii]SEA14901.1 transcriptional regulator, LysR family [Desulfuromusa kysingii]
MNISLRKLEIFTTVALSGSVTKTAEKLRLSQSAVSMALSDLESRYDEPLFVRQGRKLYLNDRGRSLLPLAQEILTQAVAIEQLLADSTAEPMGQLQIGASTTIGNYLLPLLMGKFSKTYPKASIAMQVANSDVISNMLDKGELDLALIEGPCHLNRLEQHFWRDDQLVVIAGQKHPWTTRKEVQHQDLIHADWIVREEGSGTREVFEQAMDRKVPSLPAVIELGHTEAIKKAVEAGLGVSCLSRLAVQRELDHGWLVEIKTVLKLQRPLTLLLRKDESRSLLLKACLKILQPAWDEHDETAAITIKNNSQG